METTTLPKKKVQTKHIVLSIQPNGTLKITVNKSLSKKLNKKYKTAHGIRHNHYKTKNTLCDLKKNDLITWIINTHRQKVFFFITIILPIAFLTSI